MKNKRSSVPTFGSAIEWEVVGTVFGTAFGTVIGIIISVLFISLSFLILVVSLQLSCGYQSVNCRDITWVGHGRHIFLHKVFFRYLLIDIVVWTILWSSVIWSGLSSSKLLWIIQNLDEISATRPCVSPQHTSLQSKHAQWLTNWATSTTLSNSDFPKKPLFFDNVHRISYRFW